MSEDTDVIDQVTDPDDELVDDDLQQPRRAGVLTGVLAAAVLLVLGFVVGVGVQKAAQGAAGTPVLTGTVQSISGNTVRVADSSGAIVLVTVPDDATVSTRGPGALAVGAAVTVTGSRSADGVVAATIATRPTAR
jgi:hypothetical protein